ncbi:MAG: 4-(cytidine 5'-diphospho)-2-C-methyl-D-erythritol kinase [Gallionella sp.]
MPKHLSCPAPAKLNLFLHVTGRRADGYHLLQTLFRFIDLHDTLHFELRSDGVVQRSNVIAGVSEEEDLCVRAARLLQRETGCSLGVNITLEKRIPMGGGLGGGSSDAATTLLALNRLWHLKLSREKLMALGLTLGADVPVFVFGESAFAEGVGEQLQAFALPATWYVVLFPDVHVPTAKIFTHLELTRDSVSITMRALSNWDCAKHAAHSDSTGLQLHNDLQAVVCKLYPEVQRHLDCLSEYAVPLMTGSGACVFAEFATRDAAKLALSELQKKYQMRGVVTQGLVKHPLQHWV